MFLNYISLKSRNYRCKKYVIEKLTDEDYINKKALNATSVCADISLSSAICFRNYFAIVYSTCNDRTHPIR